MNNDLDIFHVSRPWSDYDYDVYVGDTWIASAKNYAAGDDTVIAYQTREGIPAYACRSCGDPRETPGVCPACQEWQRPVDVDFTTVGWEA